MKFDLPRYEDNLYFKNIMNEFYRVAAELSTEYGVFISVRIDASYDDRIRMTKLKHICFS